MRIRSRWLTATVLAYGIVGAHLFYAAIWESADHGLSWSDASAGRVRWAAIVFLESTFWLVFRYRMQGAWLALHAAAAFLAGTGVAWWLTDWMVDGSQHGWDRHFGGEFFYCSCAPRGPILRQTIIAALVGTASASVLAPAIGRAVRRWL